VSSTTIRYSGVPENNHSRRFESESTSGLAADSDAYVHPAAPRSADTSDTNRESDLTLKWRKRLRALAAPAPAPAPDHDPEPGRRAPAPDRAPAPVDDRRATIAVGVGSEATGVRGRSEATAIGVRAEASSAGARSAETAASGFVAGFTPGKAGPTSTDPRHNRAYPHPKNPGLSEEVDGFYDWAGRRLFLSDGSPDPMTPGAYRYQTRPDLCDLDAPDSDPASPRYEPDHLRHKPGDDWLIDRARPYDVLDPGPFGSPGWFPDRRTGRHRRGELPDPIPWWEIEEEPDTAEWAEHAEALYDRRTRTTRESDARETAEAAEADRDWPDRLDTRDTGRLDDPSGRRRPHESGGPGGPHDPGGPGRPRDPGGPGWSGGGEAAGSDRLGPRPEGGHRGWDASTSRPVVEAPHRFDKLREDAWDRFLIKSAPLAAAHRTARTAIEREGGPTIGRLARFIRIVAGAPSPSPIPRPREGSNRASTVPGLNPSPRESADRTAVAVRTSRFARALRGAERARAEIADRHSGRDSDRQTGRFTGRLRDLSTGRAERAQPGITLRPNGFTGLSGPTGRSGDDGAAASLFGGAAWA
jgi:hypothetical protein